MTFEGHTIYSGLSTKEMPTIVELIEIIEKEGPKIQLWNFLIIALAPLFVQILINQFPKEHYPRIDLSVEALQQLPQIKRKQCRFRRRVSPILY